MEYKQTAAGLIPDDWDVKALSQVISFIVDNRGKSAPTSEAGIPLIATNCIKEHGLYPTKEKVRFVSPETHATWFRSHPFPDDIILVNKGTPGQVCLVPDPVDFCIAQDMVALRPDRDAIDWKFLFAYLRSNNFKKQVQGLNVGTTIPHLKKTLFGQLSIPIPSRSEQETIGNIYYDLSLKIELNNQLSTALESIAYAVFRRWFRDFQFPGFDGELIGGLPREWTRLRLGNLIEIKHGFAFKGEFFSECETDNVLITPGNFKIGGGFSDSKLKFYSGEVSEEYVLLPNDLIVTMTDLSKDGDTLGYPALTPDIREKKLLHNQRIGRVVFKTSAPLKSYLFWVMRQREYRHFVLGSATGSTVKHTSPSRIYDYEIILPDDTILREFDSFSERLMSRAQANLGENRMLQELRDTLLPKLMNGAIRVEE